MHLDLRFLSSLIAGMAALPAAALAQSTAQPVLQADAFSNANGPTVSFKEGPAAINSLPPDLHQMDIDRPSRLSVAAPHTGASLGFIRFQFGDPESPTTRKVPLRRRAALGAGRYSLANSDGVRVVLSTRTTGAFIRVTLPPRARYAAVSLTGRGARLLKVRGRCATQVFTARFVTSSGQVIRDRDTIVARRLRGARLC